MIFVVLHLIQTISHGPKKIESLTFFFAQHYQTCQDYDAPCKDKKISFYFTLQHLYPILIFRIELIQCLKILSKCKELTTFFSIAHRMWYIYQPYLNYYNNQLFFAIKSAKKTTKKYNQNFLTNQIKKINVQI